MGSNKIRIVREIKGEELKQMLGLVNGNAETFNTGSFNSGSHNTGSFNSGNFNSGEYNSGGLNSGNCNSGSHNSGSLNSGKHNSGIFNSCNYSNGIFCLKEPKISIFDIQTDMTMSQFIDSKYYAAIQSSDFNLTDWDEKNKKLIKHSYEKACQNWWKNMSKKNRKIIMSMPNFDKETFKEITSIDIDKKEN